MKAGTRALALLTMSAAETILNCQRSEDAENNRTSDLGPNQGE